MVTWYESMILLVDIEATCDEGSTHSYMPGNEMETIEIGAVIYEHPNRIVERYETLVKPVIHSQLTDFCIGLTGIKQSDVDSAMLFGPAWQEFSAWRNRHDHDRWMSWGAFDRTLLLGDCRRNDVEYSMPPHTDLSRVFKKNTGRRKGRRGALKHFGKTAGGRNHRGLNDAIDVAILLQEMTSRGWTC